MVESAVGRQIKLHKRPMKIIASLVAVFALTGCGSGLNQVVWGLNDAAAEMMGVYSAPTLASAPTPSGCAIRTRSKSWSQDAHRV